MKVRKWKKQIYIIAATFRLAIKEAQKNREFDNRDRMSNFPWGCCDDECDLLAYYLFDMYNIHTQQGNGVYRDGNSYNTTNHAWLVMDDGTIIDITKNIRLWKDYRTIMKYLSGACLILS